MSDTTIKSTGMNTDNYSLQIKAAITYLNMESLSAVADKCGAAIQLDEERCEAYLILSIAAFLMDDLGRALELAMVSHEKSPDCLEVSEILAHYHAHAGNVNDNVYFAKLWSIGESNPLLAELSIDGLNNLPKAMSDNHDTSYRVEAMLAYFEERYGDAVTSFEKELRLRKGDAELFRLFGHALCEVGIISRGLAAVLGAAHLEPDDARTYLSLASVYGRVGDWALAGPCYSKAVALAGDDPKVLAAASAYQNRTGTPLSQFDHVCQTWFEQASSNKYSHTKKTSSGGPLSIGFLLDRSCLSDMSRILEPMFWHYDREHVEYYVYSKDIPNDAVPVKFQSLVKYWLDTNEILDEKLAAIINNHDLDVLIDLTVTDNGFRPDVVARHPARKILRWTGPRGGVFSHGYDGALSLQNKKKSNQVMPVVLDPATMPHIEGAAPCHELGFVTFGGRCDLNKLNLDVIMVWGDVLRAVPGSRMLLEVLPDFSEEVRKRCIEMFTAAGVFDRIDFDKPDPKLNPNHNKSAESSPILKRLGFMVEIDIYLDIFPSNGFVELADALWAGVPVVTLVGDDGLDMAEAILQAGGHGKYIAHDRRQYVEHAVSAAKTVSADKNWRADMHSQVRQSALFDPEQWGQTFFKTLQTLTRRKPVKKMGKPVKKKAAKKKKPVKS